jgi:hypothetical protein
MGEGVRVGALDAFEPFSVIVDEGPAVKTDG